MKAVLLIPLLVLGTVGNNATTFSLKDPKGVNSIRFTLDARFEHIQGFTTAIDGNLVFDPTAPEKLTGKATVQAGSLNAHHASISDHMKQAMWLDTANFPTITFEVKKVENVKSVDGADKSWTMDVTGDFTLKGVAKSVTIPVRIAHYPGQLAKRNRVAGDLMAIRGKFSFNRRDYGVVGNQTADIVADMVDVDFTIAAFAPASQ